MQSDAKNHNAKPWNGKVCTLFTQARGIDTRAGQQPNTHNQYDMLFAMGGGVKPSPERGNGEPRILSQMLVNGSIQTKLSSRSDH